MKFGQGNERQKEVQLGRKPSLPFGCQVLTRIQAPLSVVCTDLYVERLGGEALGSSERVRSYFCRDVRVEY